MRRKLLLLTILLLPFLPVRIQAEGSGRDDIHIRITEAGVQKTSADDIVLPQMLPGDEQIYTLRVENLSKEEQELYLRLCAGEGQLTEIQEMTTLRITLRLPKETDNTYSIREAAVDVELTAQMVQSSVGTGDRTQRALLVSSILVSIPFLIIIERRRRKDHEEAL